MRVSLFITCFNDTIFPNTGKAVVRLLERLGHTVDFPMAQTCCGQMHYNTGYQREAMPIVRHFIEVFRDSEIVVSPSACCVGMVREMYPHAAELAQDETLARDVEALSPRVFELSEFLVKKLGVEDVGAYFPHRVTYHPTCHSLRAIRVGDAPLRLLRGARDRPRRVAARRGMLRFRRHICCEECGHVDGHAGRQGPLPCWTRARNSAPRPTTPA